MKLLCVFEVPGNRLVFLSGRAPNLLKADVAREYGSAKTVLVMIPENGWSVERLLKWLVVRYADRQQGRGAYRVKIESVRTALFWQFSVFGRAKNTICQWKRSLRLKLS